MIGAGGRNALPTPALPRQLTEVQMAMFSASGMRRDLYPGEIIFRKGELGRSMFVVESGQVRLEFGDGLTNKLLAAREFFGELALFIGNHARVANAVATAPTTLLVIEHAAFENLLHDQPAALAQFMRQSFAYLVASEQQLVANLKRRNEDLILTLDSLRHTQTQLSNANHLVRTDELTGLTNRRGLYQFLAMLDSHRAPDTRLGLMLIDVDRFKPINDLYGHLVGDQVLRAIAAEVSHLTAPCDLPCRLGGDEFALLVQIKHRDELEVRVAQLVAAIRSLRFAPPSEMLRLTISIGASMCREEADWSVWYSDADSALYRAKGEGGDGWRMLA
jgi:diguanylate cyclase (GGDEF)-like protein